MRNEDGSDLIPQATEENKSQFSEGEGLITKAD